MSGRITIIIKNKQDRVVISKDEYDSLIKKQNDYDQLLNSYTELRENVKKLLDNKFDLPINENIFKCEICPAILKSRMALNYHYHTKKHIRRVEQIALQKNKEEIVCESSDDEIKDDSSE